MYVRISLTSTSQEIQTWWAQQSQDPPHKGWAPLKAHQSDKRGPPFGKTKRFNWAPSTIELNLWGECVVSTESESQLCSGFPQLPDFCHHICYRWEPKSGAHSVGPICGGTGGGCALFEENCRVRYISPAGQNNWFLYDHYEVITFKSCGLTKSSPFRQS